MSIETILIILLVVFLLAEAVGTYVGDNFCRGFIEKFGISIGVQREKVLPLFLSSLELATALHNRGQSPHIRES